MNHGGRNGFDLTSMPKSAFDAMMFAICGCRARPEAECTSACLAGDIQQMFLLVELPPADRRYFRFLWTKGGALEAYENTRHVFGSKESPYVAMETVFAAAREAEAELPLAADTMLHSTIVDDTLDSRPTEGEVVQLREELKQLYARVGMNIRKWVSN